MISINLKKVVLVFFIFTAVSCSNESSRTVQIGENTFIYKSKVYRIIDSEITELGSLKSDSISKSIVTNPPLKNYGNYSMDYVRRDANSRLEAVYRGDVLYFKVGIYGLNDLRERYSRGALTLNFLDSYGFQIHSIEIPISSLIGIVDANNEIVNFEFNGKAQMSSEIYRAIDSYSFSSSLQKKNNYGF